MCAYGFAQQSKSFTENVRSLQVTVNGDPLLPPIMELGKGQHISIEFDEMSHDYHRLTYHIQHCNADWTETEGLFESDYLSGFNDQPIEDYGNSFNTTQLYTHYRLVLPNSETRIRISGNYRVLIFDDNDDEQPLLQAEFCVADPTMNITTQVSGNTDIDFNQRHQQLTYSIGYGANRIIDPQRELHTVVMQNRRQDNNVVDLAPNIQKANGVEFTHRRELIFPGGSEFHKFELLDVQKPGMNIDNIRWYEPYYHATLFADQPTTNYIYDEDKNGAFVMRNDDDTGEDATTSEYVWVHFILQTEERQTPIRLFGQWTGSVPAEECLMQWDGQRRQYHAAAYLKQGYYNYMYIADDQTLPDGSHFETENEYIILVYHRPQGGRYDKLTGYKILRTKIN